MEFIHQSFSALSTFLKVLKDIAKSLTFRRHMTPLMSAAFAGKIASVKYLLAAGAWKDHRNFFGHDAEFYAKDQGHHEIVELLQQAK